MVGLAQPQKEKDVKSHGMILHKLSNLRSYREKKKKNLTRNVIKLEGFLHIEAHHLVSLAQEIVYKRCKGNFWLMYKSNGGKKNRTYRFVYTIEFKY